VEIEERSKRRFFLELVDREALDHFVLLAEGAVEEMKPKTPVEEGAEVELALVEVGLYDSQAAVGKIGDYEVNVPAAAKLVGRKVKAQIVRALVAGAYAGLGEPGREEDQPLTAESMAERPTRAPSKRATAKAPAEPAPAAQPIAAEKADTPAIAAKTESPAAEVKPEPPAAVAKTESPTEAPIVTEKQETAAADAVGKPDGEDTADQGPAKPKKRTRRGSRGGRRRRKPAQAGAGGATATGATGGATSSSPAVVENVEPKRVEGPGARAAAVRRSPKPAAQAPVAAQTPVAAPASAAASETSAKPVAAESNQSALAGDEPAKPKKRTRRGSRGGRRHRKPSQAGARSGNAPGSAAAAGSGDAPGSGSGANSGSSTGSGQASSAPSESA